MMVSAMLFAGPWEREAGTGAWCRHAQEDALSRPRVAACVRQEGGVWRVFVLGHGYAEARELGEGMAKADARLRSVGWELEGR